MVNQANRSLRHRMPVVFGPTPGPRQGPDGQGFDYADAPRTTAGVSFLTDAASLERLLPPSCRLDGPPVVTIEHTEMRELAWLAGRGYSMLGVKFPVVFSGVHDQARGPFLAVLWENRPEPIISGREELGFAKLYCELPRPRVLDGAHHWSAIWEGHEFIRLSIRNLVPASPPSVVARPDGVLHHRYVPHLGQPGQAEIEQIVMSPAGTTVRTVEYHTGAPSIEFVRSTWEQLPTMSHIINVLAELPLVEMQTGWIAETRGASDLAGQRALI
jgi:hypothetical protein